MKTQVLPFNQARSVAFLHPAYLRLKFILLLLTCFSYVAFAQTKQWDKTFGGSFDDRLTSLQQTVNGGYMLGGHSDAGGDKREHASGLDYWLIQLDASGNKVWDKTIGGNNEDRLSSLQKTADGGYILGGYSNSNAGLNKSENAKGGFDFWLIKLDAAGNPEWDKTLGGSEQESYPFIQQTADGGFIVGGTSNSDAGDDKSEDSKGGSDYWIVKLNAAGGKEWDKTLGGNDFDNLQAIQQTADGGYMLGGWSASDAGGDKREDAKGNSDFWVVKLDAAGTKEWDTTMGGKLDDLLYALQQTTDGGYVLGGYSVSDVGLDKSENSKGSADFWVVKLNASGNKEWDKTIGGKLDDLLFSLQQTTDGGYVLGGYSFSNAGGDKREHAKGSLDYWVVKLNAAGTREWDKTLGGNNEDHLSSLLQTTDGGYILGGYSLSGISGDKTQASRGGNDYWVVKLSPQLPAPHLQSFSPRQGLPGRTVTITGQHLATTAAVRFNGVAAVFTVLSDTRLRAIVPPTATSGPITLVTAGGTADSEESFMVLQPRLLAFLPKRGAVGSTVLLLGERLGTTKAVRFNGVPTTNFHVYFNFLLTAVVPAGATTGKISVVLQGGGQATSRRTFTVLDEIPTVAALAPPTRERVAAAAPAAKAMVGEPAAYPNPFTTGVTVPLALKAPAAVQLTIYNESGQLIQHLSTGLPGAGNQQLEWNGRDSQGQPVANGIYFYRLLVNGKVHGGRLLKTGAFR